MRSIGEAAIDGIRTRSRVRMAVLGVVMTLVLAVSWLTLQGEANTQVAIVPSSNQASVEIDERSLNRALASIEAVAPRGVWVSVDTTGGRLKVFRRNELLREANCSAGSGLSLRDPRNGRVWTFQTPTGERSILRKVKDPVWTKPDWAFVEEGYEPPPLGARDRRDEFSLGAYALHLGDGYMIHGTVFQTLVGQPVTHGCIRLRDEDLEYVFRTVPAGARVLLY